jgi:enoyl-CoA hydratase/carnithine racemase
MTDQTIALTIADRIARLELRRPADANAVTGAMVGALIDAVGRASAEADIMLISGAGADFSVGRDRAEAPGTSTPYDAFRRITALNDALAGFPGIALAAVQGRAFGLAVGLIMRCDLALAAEDAVFALDEVKLGIPPMFIMAQILDHLPPKAAADLVLTSREIGAAEARDFGIVSRLVPAAALHDAAELLLAELRSRDSAVLRASKRYLAAVRELPRAARPAFALVEQARFAETKR